jgi:hypothetical protein
VRGAFSGWLARGLGRTIFPRPQLDMADTARTASTTVGQADCHIKPDGS